MHDLERIGLFKEMPYVTIGTPYVTKVMDGNPIVGKNLIVPGSKIPCANDDGYFEPFKRVFDGDEPLSYVALLRRWRKASALLAKGKSWIPSSGGKSQAGRGDPSGCFTERYPAFSAISKTFPFIHEKKNFITNPGKKGSGYGYKDVCINSYPEYVMGNKYNDFQGIYGKLNEYHLLKVAGRPIFRPPNGYGGYFTENPYVGGNTEIRAVKPPFLLGKPFIPASYPKKDGGMKAGTINPFPQYMHSNYLDQTSIFFKDYLNKQGRRLLPNNAFPTYFPTSSILDKNVTFRCNNTNIGKIDRVMSY